MEDIHREDHIRRGYTHGDTPERHTWRDIHRGTPTNKHTQSDAPGETNMERYALRALLPRGLTHGEILKRGDTNGETCDYIPSGNTLGETR